MLKPGLTLVLGILLAVFCWIGIPYTAQASLQASIPEPSSGGTTLFSFAGQRPINLGVKDGQLAACPNTPNCVNSQAQSSDQEHAIAPFPLSTQPEAAIAKLKSVIADLPRTKIVTETSDYLYVEFTSALMGFVDDVEFYVDKDAGVIHVRSASRLGQSDLGVNRKRIEDMRTKFVDA